MSNVLKAIRYSNETKPTLDILDQLLLPHKSEYISIKSSQDGWNAIKSMSTRGAPAIAIVAALSLSVELYNNPSIKEDTASSTKDFIHERLTYLVTSRPTAVNLEDASKKLKILVDKETSRPDSTKESVIKAYEKAAFTMLEDDVKDNEAIGKNGAEWILKNVTDSKQRKVNIITHCNTGSLATAGYGTALGVIRGLQSIQKLNHAYCTETRPYNQGSRLTAYELLHDKIPSTLITDSMAAALMFLNRGDEKIDAIVVGADRVTANGDTANKVGTYSLVSSVCLDLIASRH
jgi:methylthioribose-1-phosphate isomerase